MQLPQSLVKVNIISHLLFRRCNCSWRCQAARNRIPSTCQKLPKQGINNRHTPHIRPIPVRNTCDTVQYLDDIWKIFEHVIVLGCFVYKFGSGSISEWCCYYTISVLGLCLCVCQYDHSGLSKLLSPVFTCASNLVGWSVGFRVRLVHAFCQAIFAGIPADRWQVRSSVGVGGRKRSNAAVSRNSVPKSSTM